MDMRSSARVIVPMLCLLTLDAQAQEEAKYPEDPTQVTTKVGVGYTDDFVVSGSLSFGPVSKINGRINDDASEWRLGGSYLFSFGIVNVSFSRTEYDGDAYKKNYSVGTFFPLSALGVSTGKWQVFPTIGFNHNEGKNYLEVEEPTLTEDLVLLPNSSDGGYLGVSGLRPLNERWTFLSALGGSKGSGSYSGVWGGLGISYRITKKQSMNSFAFVSDDDFGRVEKVSISYTYQFGEG